MYSELDAWIILNFLKAEGASNHVEITVKQTMEFLSYKSDLIDSLINEQEHR